ncbi:hypothetical protein Bca101_101364 [Brassica carinata]
MSRSAAVAAKPRSASRRATSVQILVVVANIQMRTLKAKRKACPPWKRLSGGRVSGWKSTAASRGVGAFRPLKIRRTECAHAGRTHNASGLQGEQPLVDGTIALNVKVKKFNQARVNGGSNYDSLKRNHSQESGLGRISGKEDPVELDSSPTL